MSNVFTLCGVGICAVFAIAIIKELYAEYVKWIALAFLVLCLLIIIPSIESAIEFAKEASALAVSEYTGTILRALGITYLASFASEICNSVGEGRISSYIELLGKIEIITLSIPLFRELLDMALL